MGGRKLFWAAGVGIAAAMVMRWSERLAGLLPGRRIVAAPDAEVIEGQMTHELPDEQLGPLPTDETLARPEQPSPGQDTH